MTEHRKQCGCVLTVCSYRDVGCMRRMWRKDLREHLDEDKDHHMELMHRMLVSQKNEIGELKRQMIAMNERTVGMLSLLAGGKKEAEDEDDMSSEDVLDTPGSTDDSDDDDDDGDDESEDEVMRESDEESDRVFIDLCDVD